MPYRSVTTAGITLLCFPPHDQAFARLALRRLEELAGATPDDLTAALRPAYPEVTIRPRHALAALGGAAAWYVYRDGRYSPFVGGVAWWRSPTVAWLDIDAEGRYVDASPAALDLIGCDLEAIREMRTGDLTDPAVRPTVPWVWALLQDTGELHSTSVLVGPDGRRIPVEYRLELDASGPGRSRSYLRAVPFEAAGPLGSPEGVEDDVEAAGGPVDV